MERLSVNDPKVIEMSYNVLEKIIVAIDYKKKEELLKLADIMVRMVNQPKYPEILKLAYQDARHKIDLLSLDQLNEIRSIITSE